MPPRIASKILSKRKFDSDNDEGSQASTKKAKIKPGPNANGQPTNTTLPEKIVFLPKSPKSLRIVTWNIVSLASSLKKGFEKYVNAEDADILILCETKVSEEPVNAALTARYPYRYWSISEKKGYAGTAILSKYKPLSIVKTLPGHPTASAGSGRIVILEFSKCYVIGTYVPNAGTGLKTLDEKMTWNNAFEKYVRGLDAVKPVIWAGDLNVAPTKIDLVNAEKNWNKSAGYTEAETSWYKNFLNPLPSGSIAGRLSSSSVAKTVVAAASTVASAVGSVINTVKPPSTYTQADAPVQTSPSSEPNLSQPSGKFVDIWRDLHPGLQHYTYFSFRFQSRSKNNGWRLDMFVLSERIKEHVKLCEIRDEIWGASDHCPLVLEIDESTVV